MKRFLLATLRVLCKVLWVVLKALLAAVGAALFVVGSALLAVALPSRAGLFRRLLRAGRGTPRRRDVAPARLPVLARDVRPRILNTPKVRVPAVSPMPHPAPAPASPAEVYAAIGAKLASGKALTSEEIQVLSARNEAAQKAHLASRMVES